MYKEYIEIKPISDPIKIKVNGDLMKEDTDL